VLIKAGSTLLVARPASVRHDVTEHVADNAQLSAEPAAPAGAQEVRAAKGDTVASVARRYRVPAASVAEWNNVPTSATLRAGQALTVYVAAFPGECRQQRGRRPGEGQEAVSWVPSRAPRGRP
jgi:membrane-bound lytic murein transglycosylase D